MCACVYVYVYMLYDKGVFAWSGERMIHSANPTGVNGKPYTKRNFTFMSQPTQKSILMWVINLNEITKSIKILGDNKHEYFCGCRIVETKQNKH